MHYVGGKENVVEKMKCLICDEPFEEGGGMYLDETHNIWICCHCYRNGMLWAIINAKKENFDYQLEK